MTKTTLKHRVKAVLFFLFLLHMPLPLHAIQNAVHKSQKPTHFSISSGAYLFTTKYTFRGRKTPSRITVDMMAGAKGTVLHMPGTFLLPPLYRIYPAEAGQVERVQNELARSQAEREQNYEIRPGPFYMKLRFCANKTQHEVELDPQASGQCTVVNLNQSIPPKWYWPIESFAKRAALSYLAFAQNEPERISKYSARGVTSYRIMPSHQSKMQAIYRLHFDSYGHPLNGKTVPVKVTTHIGKNSKGKRTMSTFISFQKKNGVTCYVTPFVLKFTKRKHGLKEISRKGTVQSPLLYSAIKEAVRMNMARHKKFHQLQENTLNSGKG